MVDYVKLAATALRLVTANGRMITLIKFDQTKTDAAKPWRNNETPRATPAASLSIPAVFVSPSSLGFKSTMQDLLAKSEQVAIIATTEDLAGYHEIIDADSVRWKIDVYDKLKPSDTTLLYYVGVSR